VREEELFCIFARVCCSVVKLTGSMLRRRTMVDGLLACGFLSVSTFKNPQYPDGLLDKKSILLYLETAGE
jgi:hypothetical protein